MIQIFEIGYKYFWRQVFSSLLMVLDKVFRWKESKNFRTLFIRTFHLIEDSRALGWTPKRLLSTLNPLNLQRQPFVIKLIDWKSNKVEYSFKINPLNSHSFNMPKFTKHLVRITRTKQISSTLNKKTQKFSPGKQILPLEKGRWNVLLTVYLLDWYTNFFRNFLQTKQKKKSKSMRANKNSK